MRIVFFTYLFGKGYGSTRYVTELVRFLRKETNFTVEVNYFPIRLRYLGPPFSVMLHFLKSKKMNLRDVIIHSNNGAASLINNGRKIETYHHSHLMENAGKNAIYEKLHLLSCRKSVKIIVPSIYTKEILINMAPDLAERIMVIPNGVDTKIYRPIPEEDRNVFRKKYGILEDKICILYVGRMEKHKGQVDILKTLSLLDKRLRKKIVLFLVGSGSVEGYVKKVAKEKNIHLFHRRWVTTGELIKIYNCADLYLSLSRLEGFGLSVLEAMACGLPVIAWRTGAIGELVNGCGCVTEIGNYDFIKRWLEIIIEDSKIRKKLSKLSREKSLMYDWRNIVKGYYLKLYQQVYET